ncbi:hypothetical protein [Kitasatospora sp. NPDC001175]|uniref:hypothetical protein n=1 Tax=Kitasatospora sp. NPDC001175 TaxID=3157103 RepID=UPI003D046DA2
MSGLTRNATATAAAAVLLLAATACGSSSAHRPAIVVNLPEAQIADHRAVFPESEMQLSVGQAFTVSETRGAVSHAWYFTGPGDAHVIRNGAEVARSTCSGPPPAAGCPAQVTTAHTAVGAGTTTLTWTYRDTVACERPQEPGERCVLATKTVRVTVR